MWRCVVTGGAGFIGSHLTELLVRRGHRVTVLDDFSTGRAANLSKLTDLVDVVKGDIRDRSLVDRVCAGADLVYHLAAVSSVPRSVNDPLTTTDTNVAGTVNVLEASRHGGVRRVVFASSSAVYGAGEVSLKTEGMKPSCCSPYALTKYVGEQYCALYTSQYGLPTVSLRFFNVFGPRQDPSSEYSAVIPRFIDALARGQSPTVYGDGRQSRDFVYVDDVVEALLAAATVPGAVGESFNIGTGEQRTLLELLETLSAVMQVSVQPAFAPLRPGDVRHSAACIAKARRLLGFTPQVSFAEGLRRTAGWFLTDEGR